MDLLKGPKGLISSAIVKALDEFFVVGADHIESNLLIDAKVVVKDARLKPQHFSIHKNTFGKTTGVCVTGFIRKVSFVWSWDFLAFDRKSWIKDAALQIEGCKFKVRLTERNATNDDDGDGYSIDTRNYVEQKEESTADVQSEVNEKTAESIENGLFGCLTEQVQLALDALNLSIADFEITVEMPSPEIISNASTKVSVFEDPQEDGNIEVVELETSKSASRSELFAAGSNSNSDNKYYAAPIKVSVIEDPQEDGNIEVVELEKSESVSKSEEIVEGNNNTKNYYTVSLKIAARELSLLSYGRCRFDNDEALKEKINVSSLFINVTETFHTFHTRISTTSDSRVREKVECKTYPLLDPFSYDLGITRTHGQRFSDIGRGLVVKGRHHSKQEETGTATTSGEDDDNKGLSFFLWRPQMEAIGQLSGLILAPREEMAKKETSMGTTKMQKTDDATTKMGEISKFDVFFDNATVDLMGSELVASGINLGYLSDATDLTVKVDSFRYMELPSEIKRPGISITFSNVVTSVRQSIEVSIGSVGELYVPYVVELRSPMENVRARLVGETLILDIDSFDGSLPAHEADMEENITPSEHKQNEILIPFPLSCNVKQMCLVKKEDKETEVVLAEIELLMNPKTVNSSTDLACSIGSMKSKLASAKSINVCMNIPSPEREPNTIQDFAFSLDSLSVTAGYTIQDWKNTFRIGGKWKRRRSKTSSNDGQLKLPYASIAPLKTTITYNAMRLIAVKETTFLAKAYKGEERTTVKNLIDFYAAQCLARTPNFLENAELLGINVNKAGAFSLGATLGIASPIGPFVGVAAVVGVDAVRGSIEAGKRSRRAKEGEAAKVSDFFRGIGYSAIEATQKGKLRRGCEDGKGNVVDWMVGATVNTGNYIGKNKDALGSAGGAGAGVLVGTFLGGPVGAVIGGVVGGMTTGTAIRRIDKRIKNVLKNRELKYEDTKLKPGQLSLSP